MNDERYFLQATKEVDNAEQEEALWAKAMALSDGDVKKAKYIYVKLRVKILSDTGEQISSKSNDNSQVVSKPIMDGVKPDRAQKRLHNIPSGFVHISDFSEAKGLEIDSLIEMIKGGLFIGKEIDGEWYAKEDSPSESTAKKPGTKGKDSDKSKAPVKPSEAENVGENGSVWRRLTQGDFGLPKTYWGFYGLGTLVVTITYPFLVVARSYELMRFFFLITLIFTFIANLSVWRAASKYTGNPLWKGLAKFHMVISYIFTGLIILSIIGSLNQ